MSGGLAGPLREITSLLVEVGILYMVVGSFASTVHAEPRTTRDFDVDIVIDPNASALHQFLAKIDTDSYYLDAEASRDSLRRRAWFEIIDMRSAWKLDLEIRKDFEVELEELSRRSTHDIVGVPVPTASAEDTIIAKLEWASLG